MPSGHLQCRAGTYSAERALTVLSGHVPSRHSAEQAPVSRCAERARAELALN